MLDHVDIRVTDRVASRRFFTAVFGGEPSYSDEELDDWRDFSIVQTDADHPVTRHLHVAFAAPSQDDVDAFWRRGVEAGYPSDGEPGPRPEYTPDYYGAFLLDPDGNSVEAVHRPGRTESGSPIDHLWLGVADLDASRAFYEAIAPVLDLEVGTGDRSGYVFVNRNHRHFALVADGRPPTEHLHFAFAASDDATVAEFHRVALAAGGRDNGGPGERPEYHAGYVAAFVLDPNGWNVEAVNHNR
jgi:catechol 2,3-dioxygenase-like lactoylglutathione lyase family enzyme